MKQLSKKDLKALKGGLLVIWVCVADDYSCFRSKSSCQANCSAPSSCRSYGGCP